MSWMRWSRSGWLVGERARVVAISLRDRLPAGLTKSVAHESTLAQAPINLELPTDRPSKLDESHVEYALIRITGRNYETTKNTCVLLLHRKQDV